MLFDKNVAPFLEKILHLCVNDDVLQQLRRLAAELCFRSGGFYLFKGDDRARLHELERERELTVNFGLDLIQRILPKLLYLFWCLSRFY